MANTKKTVAEPEEFNLDQKVAVKSIAQWNVGFNRSDSIGSVEFAPRGSVVLTRNEIIAQIHLGNKLFNGIDNNGSHATLFVDDEATRREVGFDGIDGSYKQNVFTEQRVRELFAIQSQSEFEKKFDNMIKTRAEKCAIMEAIKKLNINDYRKIRFAEQHTGYNY